MRRFAAFKQRCTAFPGLLLFLFLFAQLSVLAAGERWQDITASSAEPVLPPTSFKIRPVMNPHYHLSATCLRNAPKVEQSAAAARPAFTIPSKRITDNTLSPLEARRANQRTLKNEQLPLDLRSEKQCFTADNPLPQSWNGTWCGKVTVMSVKFGHRTSFDPDMLEAKKFIVKPGVESFLTLPIGASGSEKIHLYGTRLPLCRIPMGDLKAIAANPFASVNASDCYSCGGALREAMLSMKYAKEAESPVLIERAMERIRRKVAHIKPAVLEDRVKFIEKLEQKIAHTGQDSNARPYVLPNLMTQLAEQQILYAGLVAEYKGLQLLAEGKDVPIIKDWYKHKGAAFLVHLNQIEAQALNVNFRCLCTYLLNHISKISSNTYESDLVIRHSIRNASTGLAAATNLTTREPREVIAETVMRMTETEPGIMKIEIAKVIYDDQGKFEDRILLQGTLYKGM